MNKTEEFLKEYYNSLDHGKDYCDLILYSLIKKNIENFEREIKNINTFHKSMRSWESFDEDSHISWMALSGSNKFWNIATKYFLEKN